MSLSFQSIVVVGPDAAARESTAALARSLAPSLPLEEFSDLKAALAAAPAPTLSLLLLLDPSAEELGEALKAVDAQELPRWIVLARRPAGDAANDALIVGTDHWHEAALRPLFSAASAFGQTLRTNASLRGDLRTLGRRYNHDLRSPLNGVATAVDALTEPDDAPDSSRSVLLRSINTSIDDISRLLERVGFVLKATAAPETPGPVAMGDAVWAATQRLTTRMTKAGAKITSPSDWPVVTGVAAWLDPIWVNLIGNAIQHSGPQPQIALGWEKTEAGFRFWVRDAGKGVAAEKRARLFYPFHQLNNLNAPRGFGLPITRRLVELQGGTCGYDPEPAPAGTFYFTLPGAAK